MALLLPLVEALVLVGFQPSKRTDGNFGSLRGFFQVGRRSHRETRDEQSNSLLCDVHLVVRYLLSVEHVGHIFILRS